MKTIISIILPIYNGEKHIDSLINSMFNQDIGFENLELIIIDNVSTDDSLSILENYSSKYSNIKVIELEEHYPTPGHSRNVGIQESSSEYVMFCDGDDSYAPDFCKTVYNTIKKESVDLVSSRYTVNYNSGKSYLNNSFLDGYDPVIKLDNINEFPEVIQTQANLTIWNKIYKRSFLIDNNIRFVEDHWAEDFLFALECYIKANGIVLLTDYSGYIYVMDENSQSHKQVPKQDFHKNGIVPLNKAEDLLYNNNFEVMPFVSEFIVSWVKIFLESNLDMNDLKEVYLEFKPWFKKYSLTERLINLSFHVNIILNVIVKLLSLNSTIIVLFNKLYIFIK